MRQNLILGWLAICATLLAVNSLVSSSSSAPVVVGQTAGVGSGRYVMATSTISQNEPVLFVIDTREDKVLAYSTKKNGIEFLGVRLMEYDAKPIEFPLGAGRYSVKYMAELAK